VKHHVRRIGVLSSAKIAFFVYWALGIIMTLFYGFTLALLSFVDPGQIDPEFSKMSRFVGGLGAMVVLLLGFFLSLLYAVMGAVGTALVVLAYNLLARMVGGIEVELSSAKEELSAGAAVAGEDIRRRNRSGDATATNVTWTPVTTSFPSAAPNPTASSPVVSDSAVSDSAASGPAVSDPAVSGPAVSDPAVSDAAASTPAVSDPSSSTPTVSNASDSAVSDPAESDTGGTSTRPESGDPDARWKPGPPTRE
jgi:hypothetical protein